MTDELLTRRLTESEYRNNYVYIPRSSRGLFPNVFRIVVADVPLRARIDSKNRIYLPVRKLAKPGDIISIRKIPSSDLYVFQVRREMS